MSDLWPVKTMERVCPKCTRRYTTASRTKRYCTDCSERIRKERKR